MNMCNISTPRLHDYQICPSKCKYEVLARTDTGKEEYLPGNHLDQFQSTKTIYAYQSLWKRGSWDQCDYDYD